RGESPQGAVMVGLDSPGVSDRTRVLLPGGEQSTEHAYDQVHTHTHTHTHTHKHTHTHSHSHTRTQTRFCVSADTHTHTHTCWHADRARTLLVREKGEKRYLFGLKGRAASQGCWLLASACVCECVCACVTVR